jgi:UDP-N-acetylglucosamine acyltransferase
MSNPNIHPSTVVYGDLQLEEGAVVGPYCLIQGKVKIGKNTIVEGHVSIGSKGGYVEIGAHNHLHPGAVIGGPPQDVTYKGEESSLFIGDHNVFREFSTMNLATSKGDKKTVIGSHCYFMSYTHVGHDCKVGNHVIVANDSHIGGHCDIDDYVVVGGMCAFNQFTRVGRNAFIAGGSIVNKDILPFSRAQGNHAVIRATNKVGLARRGLPREEVDNIHRAMRIMIMGSETTDEALARIDTECTPSENIEYFVRFIRESKRGIAKEG